MNISDIIREYNVFNNLSQEQVEVMSGCGQNVVFDADTLICEADQPANRFYLLRRGKIAIDLYAPARGKVPIQTLQAGDVLGWSWIFPPYRWQFDARSIDDVGAIAFDGACLRGKCDADPALGYALMKCFAEVLAQRSRNARFQLLDVYGKQT